MCEPMVWEMVETVQHVQFATNARVMKGLGWDVSEIRESYCDLGDRTYTPNFLYEQSELPSTIAGAGYIGYILRLRGI